MNRLTSSFTPQVLKSLVAAAATICIFLALDSSATNAATLNVPAQYPTIQAAINAAVNGDEVVLAVGVYLGVGNTNLNMNGKAITVRSASGYSSCTIHCNSTGRAFSFTNGEGADSVVEGIAIIYGSVPAENGGGIIIENAGPTIRDCFFLGNDAGLQGGALYVTGGEVTIEGCVFRDNHASQQGGAIYGYGATTQVNVSGSTFDSNSSDLEGGGLYLRGDAAGHITQSSFDHNFAPRGGAVSMSSAGANFLGCDFFENENLPTSSSNRAPGMLVINGGVWLISCDFEGHDAGTNDGGALYLDRSTAEANSCHFINNQADQGGAVFASRSAFIGNWTDFSNNVALNEGGAIASYGGRVDMREGDFIGNSAPDGGFLVAGNITSPGYAMDYLFRRCRFLGNSATNDGGAIQVWESTAVYDQLLRLEECTVNGNLTGPNSGAIDVDGDFVELHLRNTTMAGNNEGESSVALDCQYVRNTNIENCIFYNGSGFEIAGNSNTQVNYSLVSEGWFGQGVGNISGNPMFADALGLDGTRGTVDDDLRLVYGSPCVDAGDNKYVPATILVDLAGEERFIDDPATADTGGGGSPIVDMGAHEFRNPAPASVPEISVAGARLFANYPNPFNPSTVIRYEVDQTGPVSLKIYALNGQLVRDLVSAENAPGEYAVVWNGTDNHGRTLSSGGYLYRLTVAGQSATRTMLLLK